jgi:chitin elicitor receptor kinase 1
VTINCSCGDEEVSDDYGLFTTYPLRSGESLESVAAGFGLSGKERVLQRYNPAVNFSAGSGIVFVPTEDPNGSFRPLFSRKGNVLFFSSSSILPGH